MPAASTFRLVFKRGDEHVVLECDSADVDRVWDRVVDWGSTPIGADDQVRFAEILKRYPPPERR